jgi:hypothetical protein
MYGNVDVNVEPAEPGSGPWRAGRVHMPISFSSTWCGKCHNPFRVLVESAPGQGFVKQPGFGGMVRFWSPIIHKVVPGLSVSRTHSSSSIPRKRRRPSHCYIWLSLARTRRIDSVLRKCPFFGNDHTNRYLPCVHVCVCIGTPLYLTSDQSKS